MGAQRPTEQNPEARNQPTCRGVRPADKGFKATQGEGQSLQPMMPGHWTSSKRRTLDPYTSHHVTKPSKWIKDLNVNLRTAELLEDDRGKSFTALGQTRTLWMGHQRHEQWRRDTYTGLHGNLKFRASEAPTERKGSGVWGGVSRLSTGFSGQKPLCRTL